MINTKIWRSFHNRTKKVPFILHIYLISRFESMILCYLNPRKYLKFLSSGKLNRKKNKKVGGLKVKRLKLAFCKMINEHFANKQLVMLLSGHCYYFPAFFLSIFVWRKLMLHCFQPKILVEIFFHLIKFIFKLFVYHTSKPLNIFFRFEKKKKRKERKISCCIIFLFVNRILWFRKNMKQKQKHCSKKQNMVDFFFVINQNNNKILLANPSNITNLICYF